MTSSKSKPTHAMVLAAGLGRRMQASENDPPKPLTKIGGGHFVRPYADISCGFRGNACGN